MSKLLLPFVLLLLSISCSEEKPSLIQPQLVAQEIVFRNVTVIPMDSPRIIENQTVVAKNGKITAIAPNDSVAYGSDALVIDATGKFLLPGLAEMHAHVPPEDNLQPMKEVLVLFAVNGVTTIRGMLGHPKHLELRSKIQNGEIFGPRFFTAGPALDGEDMKTPEEAIVAVREQKQAGYDFLKILMPPLSKESFAAAVATANEVGISLAGHVPSTVGVYGAIEAGYATIDHLDGFVESLVPSIENMKFEDVGLFGMFVADKADTSKISALVNALRERKIWVVPTQCLAERWFAPDKSVEMLSQAPEMIYMDKKELEKWAKSKNGILSSPKYNAESVKFWNEIRKRFIVECNKKGVGLLLGSDAPQVYDVPGFSVHHELQYLVDAGLTPFEALRTGTVNVGLFYKRDDIGTIKVGAVSDLILLNGNPLTDIFQSRNIQGVLLGDKWLSKQIIDEALTKLEKK